MKQKLTLLLLALITTMSAWGATPASSSYPVEGKTYYLYAVQNSGARSYLYNNNGTLTVSQGTCEGTDAYRWTVTESDGAYVISNVAGKKLNVSASNLVLSDDGASFNLGKEVANEAFVSLYTNKWWVTPSSGTTFPNNYYMSSYGTNASYTASYVFEDVDADDVKYGTSTYLGTFYNSGGSALTSGFGQTWVSKGPSAVTFKNSAGNNINAANGYFFPGGSGSTYTISCQPAYRITGYTLTATGQSTVTTPQTITPAAGGSATSWAAGQENTLTVSGLHVNSTSFAMSGTHIGLAVSSFVFNVEKVNAITDLSQLSNSKSYYITGARGTLKYAAADATSMTYDATSTDLTNENYRIAIIKSAKNNYYAYSVTTGKFIATNNTLSDTPTPVFITATGNANYPWFISLTSDKSADNVNISGSAAKFIAYNTFDDGNRWAIIESADYEVPATATDAINAFENTNVTVTYKLSYNGNVIAEKAVTQEAGTAAAAPWDVPAFCSFSACDPVTVTAETSEVNLTMTSNLPFTISSSYADATWYYLTLRGKYAMYGSTTPYSLSSDKATAIATAENALWAMVGDPLNGFRVINKGAGEGKYLDAYGSTIQMGTNTDQYTLWAIGQNSNGFTLHNGSKYLNDESNEGVLGSWSNATYAPGDAGSAMTVEAVDYYDLAMAYIDQYASDNAVGDDEYFGVRTASKATYKSQIETAFSANHAGLTESVYENTIKPGCSAMIVYPESGYYRIKSSGNRKGETYITYGYCNDKSKYGLVTTPVANKMTDAGTVFKFTSTGDPGVYTLSTQGLNVQDETGYNTPFTATEAEGVTFTFEFVSKGFATIRHNTSASDACFHESNWNLPAAVVRWEASSVQSHWSLEKASSLDLTLNDGGDGYYYATVCLPFAVTLNEACAYTLTLNDSQTGLRLSDAISAVPAGTPVLLRSASASVTASIAGDASYATTPVTSTALTGVYVDTAVASGTEVDGTTDYFLGIVNGKIGFYHWAGTTLKANRAYFDSSSLPVPVKGLVLDFEDDATSIQAIDNGRQTTDAAIYNIAGQRLNKTQKGINIVNGKKILK